LDQVADISEQAAAMGWTTAQYATGSLLGEPEVVSAIVGIKTSRQIDENAAALLNPHEVGHPHRDGVDPNMEFPAR
jgi:aryl-alcohol dehydrogenase-like predicted oxidoreductase